MEALQDINNAMPISYAIRKILKCSHLNGLFNLDLLKLVPRNNFGTSKQTCFLYDKMAGHTGQRILVHLQQKGDRDYEKANFTQCIVDHFDSNTTDGTTQVAVSLHNNRLHIAVPDTTTSPIKIKHPSFCPIHSLTPQEVTKLPEDILSRGIDCGAAVILEAGDGKVLLTRRADSLRTFPGIWVPPGGHIEENESLMAAGLRELREETGLNITPDMCCDNNVTTLALWESVFPTKLTLGTPKRHHAVVYLLATLRPEHTSASLNKDLQLCTTEVGACAWFDRSQVKAIVAVNEEGKGQGHMLQESEEVFRGLVVREDKTQVEADIHFRDLLKPAGDTTDQKGRVSTGTKFALEEWLAKTERDRF